jgi:oligopeptidase B
MHRRHSPTSVSARASRLARLAALVLVALILAGLGLAPLPALRVAPALAQAPAALAQALTQAPAQKPLPKPAPKPAPKPVPPNASPLATKRIAPTPVAKIIPQRLEAHGDVRIDNYYWLRERENPAVIQYLEAENAYTDRVMGHTQALQDTLFEEMKGRIKKDDSTVPYFYEGYYYYTRFVEGGEYPIHCRKPRALEAPEQILLDVNELARGHEFYAVWTRLVSTDGNVYAYAADTTGRRFFSIYFKNLTTGAMYPDVIPNVTSDMAWANDNRTLFYAQQDPETLRSYRIYRHTLGTPVAADVLVYEEPDDTFDCGIVKTKSKRYIMIASYQTLSSEWRYLDADNPTGAFTIVQPRERDHEYGVDHLGDKFYIRTNWKAENFRVMETPVASPGKEHWTELIPNRADVLVENFELFRDYMVVSERKAGLTQLRVIPWDGGAEHYVDFGEPAYYAYVDVNRELDTPVLRYGYTSMVTPNSIFDYDMHTHTKTLRKQDEILGGYDAAGYRTERLMAPARDGVMVPISIVYPKGLARDGRSPLLLYAYGSYGISEDATFSAARLSLLQRGFAYAIAHVRGGEEMGRSWYEDGKLLKKMNTFNDYIDCAKFLIAQGYTSSDRLFGNGGSAGGLLIGAVANMAPDLFRGLIADVPFVDVVTTMLDDTIPLTTSEYDEWGNPNEKVYYDYMLSYSPYDNVKAQEYPAILVTAGLNDSQVQYWEPAKWVAKLRATKTDTHKLLLKTNMEAGHFGISGRFRQYRDTALMYAFMLDVVGREK